MLDLYLVPENTVLTANGDGAAADISTAQSRTFLVLLKITQAVEQESIDITLWGSSDGQTWSAKPIATFPQKFYPGEQPLLLDLSATPETKFIRAHWELNRWGRGPETPSFTLTVKAMEVSPDMLR